jgi:hypothetical protein
VVFAGAVAGSASGVALAACPEAEADADTLAMVLTRDEDNVGWLVCERENEEERDVGVDALDVALGFFLAVLPAFGHVSESRILKSEET